MKKANKIKLLRKQLEISQEELAAKVGINRTAISKWENGDTVPKVAHLKKLSQIFKCSIEEIIE